MTAPTDRRGTAWLLAKLFFLLASCGAGYLLFVALKNGPVAGCGTGSSCDSVLKSRWAYLLPGVPVTAPALFTYLTILFGMFFKPRSEAWRGVMFLAALTVIGAAFWFVGLQAFVLKSFCKWCMATHLCGVIGSVALIRALPPLPRELRSLVIGAAAMSLAMLVGCQMILPQKTTGEGQLGRGEFANKGRVVTILNKYDLDFDGLPVRGNPEADKWLILFFDYTCASCRRMHGYLARAEERYGEENFFVVMVPTPLNPDCNRHFETPIPSHRYACEFARTAYALWSIDPAKFREFDAWMIENGTRDEAPAIEAARAKAVELAGAEALEKALLDPQITKNIEQSSEIWNSFRTMQGGAAMPKIVWSDGTYNSGDTGSEFGLFDWMKARLGLKQVE